MRRAAIDLLALGASSVLLKGGGLSNEDWMKGEALAMADVYADHRSDGVGGVRLVELRHVQLDAINTHGVGCIFSAAVAAELAKQASRTARRPRSLWAVHGSRACPCACGLGSPKSFLLLSHARLSHVRQMARVSHLDSLPDARD